MRSLCAAVVLVVLAVLTLPLASAAAPPRYLICTCSLCQANPSVPCTVAGGVMPCDDYNVLFCPVVPPAGGPGTAAAMGAGSPVPADRAIFFAEAMPSAGRCQPTAAQ